MADKYYRLVSLIVNICPLPLRELFHLCAQNDTSTLFTGPYTAASYLQFRQNDITCAMATHRIRRDQYDKIFPTAGHSDISDFDTTLLVALLKLLFGSMFNNAMLNDLDKIRVARNDLQHSSSTAVVTDAEFNRIWGDLETATIALSYKAKGAVYEAEIREKINSSKSNHMPDLEDVLCEWYKENTLRLENKVDTLQEEVTVLKERLKTVSEDTKYTKAVLDKGTVKRVNASGKSSKRFKTVDTQQDIMQRKFSESMLHGLPGISCPKVAEITKKLREDHFVTVCGDKDSLYFQAALASIEQMEYSKDRCFELTTASDWWRVTFEEADCIVVVNPFGKMFFDQHKASAMSEVFDSMLRATRDETYFTFRDIIIISETSLLEECKKYFPHELLDAPITILESLNNTGTPMPVSQVSANDDNTDHSIANRELVFIKEVNIETQDEETPSISYICMIKPDHLILYDENNSSLKLINLRESIIEYCEKLPCSPSSLAVLPEDKIAVGNRDDLLIRMFHTDPVLKMYNKIKLNDWCSFISYANDKLFVFFYTRQIKTYNLEGESLQTFKLDSKIQDACSYCFNGSLCIDKTSFYISDFVAKLLFRVDLGGKLMATYKDEDLANPAGILVMSDGSLLLCNSLKNSVLQMRADLTRPRVILGPSDDINFPRRICSWNDGNTLIIAGSSGSPENTDSLKMFSFT